MTIWDPKTAVALNGRRAAIGGRLAEDERLDALARLEVLDTDSEQEFDELAALAARVFDAPSAYISLIDRNRQWVKASLDGSRDDVPPDRAFCDHTIRHSGLLVVEDTMADARFASNPLVTGEPFLRFYAGAPLITSDGYAVGSVCVVDQIPRVATPYQQAMLMTLADQIITQMEMRASRRPASAGGRAQSALISESPRHTVAEAPWANPAHLDRLVIDGLIGYVESSDTGIIQRVNAAACRMMGYTEAELIGRSAAELAHPDHVDEIRHALSSLPVGHRDFYDATRVYRHRTGRKLHVRVTVHSIPATGTRAGSVGAFVVDMTGKLAADSSRVIAEQAMRRVLDTATDAYISLDAAGIVTDWNTAAERLFGYPAERAIGQVLSQLIVPPDLVEAHRYGLERVAAGGTARILGRALELPARRADGSQLQIELTAWSTPLESGALQFHAFCRDISDRVAAAAALTASNRLLNESRAQLKAGFEASPTADAVLDDTGALVDVNAALCRFLGRSAESLVRRRWAEVVYGPDWARAERALATALTGNHPVYRTELRCVTEANEVVWGLISLVPMTGPDNARWVMLRVEDLQAHKELERTLSRQASHDAISGLPNRSLFLERVRQLLASRRSDSPVGVLIVYVGGLNPVIDRDGYTAGDHVLALLAERMGEGLDEAVTLAHLQPGQFGAVLAGGALEASRLSDRLLEAIRTPVAAPGGAVTLRASIGISIATSSAGHAAAHIGRVVQDAESAAQLARAEGGDCAVFAAPEMRAAQNRQEALEHLIRDALANDEIYAVYQPVFDLTTGDVVSAEALLRMSERDGRPLPPLHVIPAAEASGLIIDIGRRMLQLAARQAAEWRRDLGRLIPVAVNVSAVQLSKAGFVEDVMSAISAAGIPPEAMRLELTESVLLKAGSSGIELLRELHAAGIELAIDDFGTGYASLSYLRDMPASTLKIDRSFVAGIPDDAGAMAIVSGVIGLAGSFGMSCIAEGIETDAQWAHLADRGVLGQGYRLGVPDRGSAMARTLRVERP